MNLSEIVAGSLSEEELLEKMIADLRTLKEGISGLEKFDADSAVICIEIRAMIGTSTSKKIASTGHSGTHA